MIWPWIVGLCLVVGAVMIVKWWMGTVGPEITQEAFVERMKEPDYLLLDVRAPHEYASGHVPGAHNIRHTHVSDHLDELQRHKDRDIVVYCEHGLRARLAQRTLLQAGFPRVSHLAGDMLHWRKAGRPIEAPTLE